MKVRKFREGKRSFADFADFLLNSRRVFNLVFRFAVFGPPVMYGVSAVVSYFLWGWGVATWVLAGLALYTGWVAFRRRMLLRWEFDGSLNRFVYQKKEKVRR